MGTWLLVSTGLRSVTPITYFLPLIKGFGNTRENYFKDFMAFPPSVIVLTPNSCGLGGLICKPDIEAFDKMDQILNKDYIFNTVIDGYRFYIKK